MPIPRLPSPCPSPMTGGRQISPFLDARRRDIVQTELLTDFNPWIDGSITLPCLQSSLYGLKPTHGLLSRAGIVPFAPSFDSAGPMAKDVWSLAVALDVMQGEDDDDDASEYERP